MGLVNPVYWLHLASPSRSKSRFFYALPDRVSRLAADRVFELEPGRLVDLLQVVPFFADLLNSPLRQEGVVDALTEHSEHPEASSWFLSGDCAQVPAVVGRINRLRMRPVPAPDLKVEWTRNDRLKNLFAD